MHTQNTCLGKFKQNEFLKDFSGWSQIILKHSDVQLVVLQGTSSMASFIYLFFCFGRMSNEDLTLSKLSPWKTFQFVIFIQLVSALSATWRLTSPPSEGFNWEWWCCYECYADQTLPSNYTQELQNCPCGCQAFEDIWILFKGSVNVAR